MGSTSVFYSVFVILHVCLLFLNGGVADITLPICPGKCVSKETSCNSLIDHTNCGLESVCCLDDFEMTTEPGFDFSTLSSEDSDQWVSTEEEETSHPTTEFYEVNDDSFFSTMDDEKIESMFTTMTPHEDETSPNVNGVTFEQCPGACIPNKHSGLCQYIIPSDILCPQGKACCATKEAAQKLQELQGERIPEELYSSPNECPGKCIHPSLTIFCDQILPEYYCPMDSKCCDKPIASATPETQSVECTGECLSPQSTYLCLPPYELMPGTSNCKQSTVCCMRSTNEDGYELPETDETGSLNYIENSGGTSESHEASGGLVSDEHGQLYYVYQSGQFRPLPTLTPEESLSPSFAHFTDVAVEGGKASIYKDAAGNIYQLSVIQSPEPDYSSYSRVSAEPLEVNFQRYTQMENHPQFQSYSHMGFESPQTKFVGQEDDFPSHQDVLNFPSRPEQKPMISAPDDSDDIEENLMDVVIPDEGEDIINDSVIPPGERTMIKPQCPGSCVSTFLKFTCIRKSALHDGFSCPANSVCCASLKDIEEHERYLASLSPYFKATPIENEENRQTCFAGKLNDVTSKQDKTISDYCWQVAIINSQNQYICGGVAIHDSWILTAAHCVTGALRQDQALYVRAGVTDLTNAGDSTAGQTRRALSIFVHHKHNSMSLDNDIALLRLQTPLKMNSNVCVACLPSKDEMPSMDASCIVSGYGFVSKVGTLSLKIHDAKVPLIDDMDCIANVTDVLSTVFILPGSSFCAGGRGLNEACQGDAGGPLMCHNNGRSELTGLVSWSLGCGKDDVPSIYVKIPSFMSWINQIISASAFLKALT